MEKLRKIGIKKLTQVTQQQVAKSWLHSMFFRLQIPCWKEEHCFCLASEKSINCQSLTHMKMGSGDCRVDSAMSAYASCKVSIFKRICTMQLAHRLWDLKSSSRRGTKNTKTFLLQILVFMVKASAWIPAVIVHSFQRTKLYNSILVPTRLTNKHLLKVVHTSLSHGDGSCC